MAAKMFESIQEVGLRSGWHHISVFPGNDEFFHPGILGCHHGHAARQRLGWAITESVRVTWVNAHVGGQEVREWISGSNANPPIPCQGGG